MKRTVLLQLLAMVACSGTALAVVGGGDITMKGGTAGNVLFSHDTHVDSSGLGCKQCHPTPYLDTKQHRKVTMKEMQQGKSCGVCHNGKEAFSVKGDCNRCHRK